MAFGSILNQSPNSEIYPTKEEVSEEIKNATFNKTLLQKWEIRNLLNNSYTCNYESTDFSLEDCLNIYSLVIKVENLYADSVPRGTTCYFSFSSGQAVQENSFFYTYPGQTSGSRIPLSGTIEPFLMEFKRDSVYAEINSSAEVINYYIHFADKLNVRATYSINEHKFSINIPVICTRQIYGNLDVSLYYVTNNIYKE